MWVRSSAIRPVPSYARVSETALEIVQQEIIDADTRRHLDDVFGRFESAQPELTAFLKDRFGRPLDETALALGYFLCVALWRAFEHAHGPYLKRVSEQGLSAAMQAIQLDEELRQADPNEALDTDDVIASEQPALLKFLYSHVDATLELHAEDIDVDDVYQVYKTLLVAVLALSYAVEPPEGYPIAKSELLA